MQNSPEKMRVAICVTNDVPMQVPPGVIYAPAVSRLQIAEELSKRGHEVTLFCSEDTIVHPPMKKVSAGLVSTWQRKRSEPETVFPGAYYTMANRILYTELYAAAARGEFDVLLVSSPQVGSAFLPFVTTPTLFTLHDPLDTQDYQMLTHFSKYQNHAFISISDSQRKPLPSLEYLATIPHSVDCSKIPFSGEAEDYAIFFGRIVPEKGVIENIQAALEANIPIKVIGPVGKSAASLEYWRQVEPYVDGNRVQYYPSLSKEELFPLVARAKVFLNLIQWEEPFGMVMIESLACGTPVIASNRGSVPEIIESGKTGFVVSNHQEAVEALKKIDSLDRTTCRRVVEARFNLAQYIDQYENALHRTIQTYGNQA